MPGLPPAIPATIEMGRSGSKVLQAEKKRGFGKTQVEATATSWHWSCSTLWVPPFVEVRLAFSPPNSFMSDVALPRRAPRLVAIDDDPLIRRLLERFFEEKGYALSTAADGATGLERIQRERPDVVILDNVLPDLGGLEVLRQIRAFDRHLPVLFVTAQGTSRTAIEAMKLCAFDYLPKPLDLARLDKQVERALEARRLMRTPVQLQSEEAADSDADFLIGRSAAMQEVYKAIGRVSLLDAPILIEGEPGTGKESVARAVYQNGPRNSGPFHAVNCADYDAAGLDVELFGAERFDAGTQTTAHIGRVEQCRGGVILLNGVDQLTAASQSRVLRLIHDREYERVGGRETCKADVQLICVTSQCLTTCFEQGRFRAELYYLLRSFRIGLPPLRNRADDIPLLVDHFVKRFSRLGGALSAEPVRVSAESLSLLAHYAWPGNLDELQSVLRRALVETKGTVVASDFLLAALGSEQDAARSPSLGVTDWRTFAETRMSDGSQHVYADALAEMERNLLMQVLQATQGNQARSARILGITRGNLRKKIRAHGILLAAIGGPSQSAGHDAEDDVEAELDSSEEHGDER
ncbi:MAG: Fis family transcriptional regulator [Pirellula sp.]|nr:Fis family transcriptional regulator [Pirellula sp.]